MELKEEYQNEVEEAVKKEINCVRNQMELQERKHQFEMEKKEIDMATMEAALSRALARTKEVEQKLHEADRAMTKAKLKKITKNEAKKSEQVCKTFKTSRPTG